MISRTQKLVTAIAIAGILVVSACSDGRGTLSPQLRAPSEGGRLQEMTSCGASFTAITDETDSLMTAYGIGSSSDTVNVCESWTGSDYDYQVAGAGSSDNVPGFADTVQTVAYQSAYLNGYTQSGAPAADPTNVGTLFDFVVADNPTRQASYDEPYYGVSSHDPNACTQPPCPVMSRASQPPTASSSSKSTPPQSRPDVLVGIVDTLFTRHGLSRRGVRALVNESEEITRSAQGYRRFRMVTAGMTVVRSIDPLTQLLMAEQSDSAGNSMAVTHRWTKVVGGYLLDRSDYVSVETIGGRQVRSFGSVRIRNTRISDPAYPPLNLPIPAN